MVIAALFRSIDAGRLPILYGFDLMGACLGSICCVFAMEYGGYRWPLALIVGLPLVAGGFLAQGRKKEWRIGLIIGLALSVFGVSNPVYSSYLEPRPNLQMVGRTHQAYRGGDVSSEEWHTWNSYGRIAEIAIKNTQGGVRRVFAFGPGQGHAVSDAYVPGMGRESSPRQEDLLSILAVPRRALVLFAGVGKEVIVLDRVSGGRMDITAVEVNRQMVGRALSRKEQGLRALFAKENIHFNVAEARTFLERDPSRYDLILAPFFGSVRVTPWADGDLSQFMFTREALRSVLGHLTREGMSITYDANKVVLLANLKSIPESFGNEDPARCVIVMSLKPLDRRGFFQPEAGRELFASRDWSTPFDDTALLLKPSGFSSAELMKVRSFAKDRRLEILYTPDTQDSDNPYWQVLRGGRLEEVLPRLQAISRLQTGRNIRLAPRTDDAPNIVAFGPARRRPSLRRIGFVEGIVFVGLALALAAVLSRTRRQTLGGDLLSLCLFAALGYGFMFVEVGFILTFGLFLGNPVYSMSITLSALLFFSGLGSLSRGPGSRIGLDTIRNASFGTAAAVVAVICFVEKTGATLLGLPLGLRVMSIVLLLAPVGFFMGQIFAQGLVLAQRRSKDWTALAWAVNGFSSAGAVVVAGTLPQYLGFRALLWRGAGLYLAIFVAASLALRCSGDGMAAPASRTR